ncbi:MAG: alanine--tRNA ligase [Dehalococcoidales bacterium]|nr:alanine--tRNA ligase [Dehalococcoidales bacterium]
MTSDEIRTAFLSFFESKGHKIIPSSSLIPHGDPTLLLTSAGMVQFKPYFLGEAAPPNPRLASCQKCFRTTDIESVGDATHLTFFEMLGNFSIGDYFKKEAIGWAWEFVTEHLRLPPERLWISIFLDDEEALHHWLQLGVPEARIVRMGEEDNFWGPAGDSGPCGPCSEIYYDFGEEAGCGLDSCGPGCDCRRFSEIWNLVFTQYNQDKDGKRTLLPRPNIDTGMGLERIAAALQSKKSVYGTDLFTPLMERIAAMTGKGYGVDDETDNAIRVVAEHSRGIAFLIADGVLPSNEGRGYVLRRLLRRAALFGRKLGLDKPFLAEMAEITIRQMKHIYPELELRRGFILKVIEPEEARFGETLDTGLELLDGIVEKTASKKGNVISGKDMFKLYDTYGFPVELTKEIAASKGFSVDLEGFEKEMEQQRRRAKAAHKFELAVKEVNRLKELDIKRTVFTGYDNLRQKTAVINVLAGNDAVGTVEKGQEASLILDSTPFYGEMGGQVGDTGEIRSAAGRFAVTGTVRMLPDIIMHLGSVIEGSLSVGDEVEAMVDEERRRDIARNHTATHLLQAALRQVVGEHIQQRGSLVAPDQFRFDFSHLVAMTKEEIRRTNSLVNEKIRQDLPVYDEELPYKKAVEAGAIALFDEKYGDVVRVLRIGRPPISVELCGGTHVSTTGEIGFFHITGESSIGAGLRRIEAVTGRGAEAFVGSILAEREEIARLVGASLDEVKGKVAGTVSMLDSERRRAQALERELSRQITGSLLNKVEEVNGTKILVAAVPSFRIEALREMSDLLREQLKSAVIVLGTVYQGRPVFLAAVTPDLVTRGFHAGEIVRQVAEVTGGSGGGKATLAQAGGKNKDKLDEALSMVKKLL